MSPPTSNPMPASQRGFRNRSMISRMLGKRDAGCIAAARCCRTKPVPTSSAASTVVT